MCSNRGFPLQEIRCGEGARYFDPNRALWCEPERLRFRRSLASREAVAQANLRGPAVPTGERTARSGCATEMPGWRREELLRLSHDVGLTPRNSARFSSRRKFWPARIADQSAVRAGAGEADRLRRKTGPLQKAVPTRIARCMRMPRGRGWTWCRAGLLRLSRGRCGFDSHLNRKIQWLSGPSA